MSGVTYCNARLVTPEEEIFPGWISVAGERVVGLGAGDPPTSGQSARANVPPSRAELVDLRGMTVTPGLIDVHVHGAGGYSALGGYAGVQGMAGSLILHGVTAFLPTVMTAPEEVLLDAVTAAGTAVKDVSTERSAEGLGPCVRGPSEWLGKAEPLGVNLEGPFLNPGRRGAHPEKYLKVPSREVASSYWEAADGTLRLVTIAPEIPGAAEVIRWFAEREVVVAAGHTAAGFEAGREAVSVGVRHVTHLFNAMSGFHHREPGLVGLALYSPELTVELIGDGVHVHPVTLFLCWRLVGSQRLVLVSDGMEAAGLGDGSYELAGQPVVVRDGVARLPEGTLAGSTATLDQCIRTAVHAGIPFRDALLAATVVPAGLVGTASRKGRLAPGMDADLTIWDAELRVRMCVARGQVVRCG